MAISLPSSARGLMGWRTPVVIVLCGCLISMISFGPRATLGFFLTPMSQVNGWGRDVFGLALAIQNILWGLGQPFAGAIADRFGTARVLCAGGALYAIGLILLAYSTSPGMLALTAGVCIGFGLSGCSFSVVLAAFGKLLPESWRLVAFGAGAAAGSFGQFLYSPVAVSMMDAFGWQTTLVAFGAGMLLVLPLSLALTTAPAETGASGGPRHNRSARRFRRRWVTGPMCCWCSGSSPVASNSPSSPFTCRLISSTAASRRKSAVGPSRRSGSSTSSARWPRAGSAPSCPSATSCPSFISRVPPRSSFSSFFRSRRSRRSCSARSWACSGSPRSRPRMGSLRWLATLAGLAFFSHQVGGFLGVWLGGIAFVRTGSYDVVWWLSILFGVLSAVINLPIVEKPVVRAAAAPA